MPSALSSVAPVAWLACPSSHNWSCRLRDIAEYAICFVRAWATDGPVASLAARSMARSKSSSSGTTFGLGGVYDVSGVHQLQRFGHAYVHGKQLGAAVVGRQRALGEYGGEAGALGSDSHVAREGESEARAYGGAVDGGYGGTGEPLQHQ